MLIRDFAPADLDAVVLLNVRATDPRDTAENSIRYNPDLLDIPNVYQKAGAFFVGDIDRDIVAMGAIQCAERGTFILTRIRVAIPKQRQGLARRIVRALEDRARALGGTTITLDTTDKQVPAQRLYESLGYTITHNSVLENPFGVFNLVHYRKEL